MDRDGILHQLGSRFSDVTLFAEGRSGVLYMARDSEQDRRGVLKILHPQSSQGSDGMRLRRELARQLRMSHPNLGLPSAMGEVGGCLWLFRPYVEGETLRARLEREGVLPMTEALAIAAQLASALDELHRGGMLHRDLKPEHVILSGGPEEIPRVVLIDAAIVDELADASVPDLRGTPAYVSPEQAKGKLVSFRSDLYSLGCVLYEALTGRPPYMADDPSAVLAGHVRDPVPAPPEGLPDGGKLLSSLLAKEPRQRPFSAQQVRRQLDPFLPDVLRVRRKAAVPSARVPSEQPSPPSVESPSAAAVRKKTLVGIPALSPDGSGMAGDSGRPPGSRHSDWGEEATQQLDADELQVVTEAVKGPPPQASIPPPLPPGVRAKSMPLSQRGRSSVPPPVPPQAQRSSRPPPSAPPPPVLAETRARSAVTSSPPPRSSRPPPPPPRARVKTVRTAPPLRPAPMAAPVPAASPLPEPAREPSRSAEVAGAEARGAAAARLEDDGYDVSFSDPPVPAVRDLRDALGRPARSRRGLMVGLGVGAFVAGALLSGLVVYAATSHEEGAADEPKAVAAAPETEHTVPAAGAPHAAPAVKKAAPPAHHEGAPAAATAKPAAEPAKPAAEPAKQAEAAPPAPKHPSGPTAAERAQAARQKAREQHRREVEQRRKKEAAERAARRRAAAKRPSSSSHGSSSGGAVAHSFDEAQQMARDAFRRRDYAGAARAYQQATHFNPRHAGSYAGLGAARMALGDARAAVSAYKQAVRLEPSHSGFYAALGRAYQSAGDTTNAKRAYQHALQLDPNNRVAQAALKSL